MPQTPITYENAEVTRDSDMGFFCRVAGSEIFVGQGVPLAGTSVRIAGDRGRLVLPRWFAHEMGLPIPIRDDESTSTE